MPQNPHNQHKPLPNQSLGLRSKMNVHGTNPSAVREAKGRHDVIRANERAQERIERAHEAKARKLDRKMAEAGQAIAIEHKPIVEKLFANIASGMGNGTIQKRNGLIRALAADEWFIDKCESEALKRKVLFEKLLPEEREVLSYVGGEMRTKYLVALLGENPSVSLQKDILEQIQKWKGRVPGMLQGHY